MSKSILEKAIKSVLMQQDVAFELFVVDDCSKDKTSKLVESIVDKRIELIKNCRRIRAFNYHNLVIDKALD